MAPPPTSTSRICTIYAAASASWVVISDLATHATWAEAAGGMAKGLLFVAVSTGLLFLLLR